MGTGCKQAVKPNMAKYKMAKATRERV